MHDLQPGSQLTIHYPRIRHILYCDRSPMVARSIIVREVVDLVEKPLTPEEFLRRPYLRRGRWLVKAIESIGQKQRFRQFYLANSAEFRRHGGMRLALYEPGKRLPVEIISEEFLPTVVERKMLIRLVKKLKDADFGGLQLRIVADDFRILS
jgi:hypothetical protein